MNIGRINEILSNDEKCERVVWIQGVNSDIAKVGFVDNFEEKNVPISDLYEKKI